MWLRRDDHQIAEPHQFGLAAIDAYPETADQLVGVYNNKPTLRRFARGLDLAMQMGQQTQLDSIVDMIEDRIRKDAGKETTWYNLKYSQLLYQLDLGDTEEQANLMEDSAAAVLSQNGVEAEALAGTCRKYWEQAAKWHARARNDEGRHNALAETAEWHVRRAEIEELNMAKAESLADAYHVYQNVPNAQERKEEIYRALLRAQEQAVSEFGRMGGARVSDQELQERAKRDIRADTLESMLVEFAFIQWPTPLSELEEMTRNSAQLAPLQALIGGKDVNALGRVTAKKPSVTEDESAAFEYEVFKTARFDWVFSVVNRIEPARAQIIETFDVGREPIYAMLDSNPLVPPGRERAFTVGLTAGFNGDFLTASHFLCVQFEESVRYLLNREGVITSGFTQYKTQYERNLNNFLDSEHVDYRPAMLELFGRDIVFHLQALLVDERGANLRNGVAHALLPDSAYSQAPAVFYWWLVWHLVIYGAPRLDEWLKPS
jgi:hypothetical protein